MNNPLKETFTEKDLTVSSERSFESRVEIEMEKIKHELSEIQPEDNESINFYFNEDGIAVMVIGETPDHLRHNEFCRNAFQRGTKTKRLMRKLEDLNYVKENGEFPNEVPRPTLVGTEKND